MRSLSIIVCAWLVVPSLSAAQQEPWKPERGPTYGAPRAEWVSRQEVRREADRFAERTAQLYRTLIREDGYEQLGERARRLAVRAERLRRDVREGAPYSATLSEYYDLQEDLHGLRARVFRVHRAEHSERVAEQWGRVMAAHDRMALALNVPSEALCEPEPYQPWQRRPGQAPEPWRGPPR